MRITGRQFGERERQLPARSGAGQPASVRVGGWQQQEELTLGGAEQPRRQTNDPADELVQAHGWLADGVELSAETGPTPSSATHLIGLSSIQSSLKPRSRAQIVAV